MSEYIWCKNANSPHYGRRRNRTVCKAAVERSYAYTECYKCKYGGNGEIKRTANKKKGAQVVDSPQRPKFPPTAHMTREGNIVFACALCEYQPEYPWLCTECVHQKRLEAGHYQLRKDSSHESRQWSEDRKFLHRGHSPEEPGTEQENLGRAEVAEEVPFYQSDQNKEALLFA
jgi:hypothetical protein